MGLLSYLLSKPDNWQVSVSQLVAVSASSSRPDGRDSVYAILAELRDARFLRRTMRHSEDGRTAGFDYEVFDVQQPAEPAEESTEQPFPAEPEKAPFPALPYTAEPFTAEPTLTNTVLETSTERENKAGAKARKRATTPLPEGFQVSDAVRKWAKERGYGDLDVHLEVFITKCQAKGYTYVDWDRAFMSAIREDWARTRQGRPVERPYQLPRGI